MIQWFGLHDIYYVPTGSHLVERPIIDEMPSAMAPECIMLLLPVQEVQSHKTLTTDTA